MLSSSLASDRVCASGADTGEVVRTWPELITAVKLMTFFVMPHSVYVNLCYISINSGRAAVSAWYQGGLTHLMMFSAFNNLR